MIKRKLLEWLKRYLPLEVFSYIAIFIAIVAADISTGDTVLAATIGTYAGYIAYFGLAYLREIISTRNYLEEKEFQYKSKNFFIDTRNVFLEFAPALLVRLIVLNIIIMITQGIVNDEGYAQLYGNIISDVIFYIIVISSYEIIKKKLKKEKSNYN